VTAPTPSTGSRWVRLRVDRIKVGERFRKDLGSIDALVDSIREVGLLHAIVVDSRGNLIAGERRLAACQRLGWRDIPATILQRQENGTFVDLDDAGRLRAEHDENTIRQPFTPSEAVAIAKAIKDRVKTPVGQHADQRDSETFAISGRTVDKAAEFVGMSGRTLEKATAVVEAAAADPELEHVVDEMDKTGKVDPAYQKLRRPKPKPPTPAEIAGRNSARSKRCDEEISHLMHKYHDLKRWQPVWDAYRNVVNADRVIDIVPAVAGAESTTTPTPTPID